jgi:hypothetical protein
VSPGYSAQNRDYGAFLHRSGNSHLQVGKRIPKYGEVCVDFKMFLISPGVAAESAWISNATMKRWRITGSIYRHVGEGAAHPGNRVGRPSPAPVITAVTSLQVFQRHPGH